MPVAPIDIVNVPENWIFIICYLRIGSASTEHATLHLQSMLLITLVSMAEFRLTVYPISE